MVKPSNEPLVSVILAIHNGADYCREAVDSVLAQEYSNFELVILDDASTDNTADIIREYAENDSRIVFETLPRQESLSDVLNIGIGKSSGKYVSRIDHDDRMTPKRLKLQVQLMEKHPDVVVCGGFLRYIYEDGSEGRIRKYPLDDKDLKKRMFVFSPFAHPSVMIRRSALEQVRGYPKGIRTVEDIMLWFKLSRVGKFANIPEILLEYRIRAGSESLGKIISTFNKTNEVRYWAMDQEGIKPSFYGWTLWKVQQLVFIVLRFLPSRLVIWFYDLGKRLFG